MKASYSVPALRKRRARSRSHQSRASRRGRNLPADSFLCQHCAALVSTVPLWSGVQNRNHCPFCLWSRHLDLHGAGDRLSACKSLMRPIGLTVKATRKKYGRGHGELMLIHLCTACESLSINRIAADDVPQAILRVYQASFRLDIPMRKRLDASGIRALGAEDRHLVYIQLFGRGTELAGISLLDDLVTT